MTEGITSVAGIEIPSADPIFLGAVGVHILLGLACTVTGAVAMLSQKRAGRHPLYGTIYFWCLAGIFLTATSLSVAHWARMHIAGMGASYVLLLIAFYVDNGKQLPVWKDLPHFTYWLLPLAAGIPLIVRALLWHPLTRQKSSP